MKHSQVRIIAGKWRRRYIEFPDAAILRPTPNRVRETLFNWLMDWIVDAVCIDAFAGSGALGFEALSRGAAKVVAFEQDQKIYTALQKMRGILESNALEIIHGSFFASKHLPQAQIIFLDPPFNKNLLPQALDHLVAMACLASQNRIYFEVEKDFDFSGLSKSFELIKKQTAGEVCFGLLTYSHLQS